MPITPNAAKKLLVLDDEDEEILEEDTEPSQVSVTYFCEVIEDSLSQPCSIRKCPLWVCHDEFLNCAGAYASLKSAQANERLAEKNANAKDHVRLRDAANGRLSYVDLSVLYRASRQTIEQAVNTGSQCIEQLIPVFQMNENSETKVTREVSKDRATTLFTYVGNDLSTCVCCESPISEAEEGEALISADGKTVWCSEECAEELPLTAFTALKKYAACWQDVLGCLERKAHTVGDIAQAMGVHDRDVRELLRLRDEAMG